MRERLHEDSTRRELDPHLPWRRRVAGLAAAVLLLTGTAACSSDGSDGSATTVPEADPETDGGAAEDPGGTTGEPEEPKELTAEAICAALPVAVVAEATGLEITGAEPSTSSTPQCAYTYPSENGPDSNLTVAATRITSSDALSVEDAFDGAVRANLAGAGPDATQTEVEAGDEAVLISGVAADLGALRVGDALATIIVPLDTVTEAEAEALLVAVGDAFA